MTYRLENFEADRARIRQKYRQQDLAAQERRYKLIDDREAARVARGEPRQPPHVPRPDDEAYKARARFLMAK
jgi:hypothetical protein